LGFRPHCDLAKERRVRGQLRCILMLCAVEPVQMKSAVQIG
jgi:hypothetical protein